MEYAKEFLVELTKLIPPGEGEKQKQRHNLTIDENENLILTLMLGEQFISVTFSDEDLINMSAEDLVREVYEDWMKEGPWLLGEIKE